MDTGLPLFAGLEYKIADESPEAVAFGRKELDLALHEMPGLASLREEFRSAPKRARAHRGAAGVMAGARGAARCPTTSSVRSGASCP